MRFKRRPGPGKTRGRNVGRSESHGSRVCCASRRSSPVARARAVVEIGAGGAAQPNLGGAVGRILSERAVDDFDHIAGLVQPNLVVVEVTSGIVVTEILPLNDQNLIRRSAQRLVTDFAISCISLLISAKTYDDIVTCPTADWSVGAADCGTHGDKTVTVDAELCVICAIKNEGEGQGLTRVAGVVT
ncbi:MAG: hypothetical protein BWY63_03306 [Chloroflexi bacterium ADurb.Bin360]|nr:MAG: hypothetical protein BWY63_03306 [Chloroflexi bacterium ADurb.Bin360]